MEPSDCDVSTSGLIGTIGVAVDHSDATLNRYLAGVTDVRPQNRLIRRALAAAAANGLADSLVVCPEDTDWALVNCANVRLIIGLPDVHDGDDVLNLINAAISSMSRMNFPVKLGFAAGHPDLLKSVSIVRRIRMDRPDVRLIAEPYFAADVSLADRTQVLRELTAFDNVIAFKLDVESPESSADVYSRSIGAIPWFARSDGLDYQAFLPRLRVAVGGGCSGVIAGAAIWRSELGSMMHRRSGDSLLHVVSERITELRDLCASAPPVRRGSLVSGDHRSGDVIQRTRTCSGRNA